METKKEFEKLTWTEFDRAVKEIANRVKKGYFKNIYGIPRGGLVVAVKLSHLLGLPLIIDKRRVEEKTLIVDDIVETGNTIAEFNNNITVSIYLKKTSMLYPDIWIKEKKDKFIKFPWESEKSAKVDYADRNSR
jgi:hypoxanthine phosphoribosyltransferase